jgi:hypothetical protein
MTPLERKILQHVQNAATQRDFDPNLGCNLPEDMGAHLSGSERVAIEDVLWSLFDRGWLAKRADCYYVPTHAGEAALSAK